jgi:ribonuclease HII
MLKQYREEGKIEVGLDEAGRGCLLGPVCVAGVIWLDKDPDETIVIKDSKKYSEKKRIICNEYILNNCISYSINMVDNNEIDEKNILKCSMEGMHKCLDDISKKQKFDSILVDGNHFPNYYSVEMDDFIPHTCVIKGDDTYKSIAAASVLAKTHRDEYIKKLVQENPELEKYDILKNKGYGTKKHIEAIHQYGITKWHRKTFAPCNQYVNQMKE